MTPVFSAEGSQVAPVLGANLAADRDGVAVLNDDGIVLFTGCAADALAYISDQHLTLDWDCEITENRAFSVGFEAF